MIIDGAAKSTCIARIDVDVIAFNVSEHEVETISQFLLMAIANRSLVEYGRMPDELD